MTVCKLLLLFLMPFLIYFSDGTIDINLTEYQYLADHLTENECHELVSALHFHTFELPKDINAAERRLPEGVPCLDLLLHWNSSPREGRGETHVEVCHRLNQIGREDLAEWLSRVVFHEISKDLKVALTAEAEETTFSTSNVTEALQIEEALDEAAWLKIDSFLEAVAVCSLMALILGSFFLCILCCTRKSKKSRKGYAKLRRNESDTGSDSSP